LVIHANGVRVAARPHMPPEQEKNTGRRGFLEAAIVGATLAETVLAASDDSLPHPQETRRGDMLYRSFGKTGETVSALGVGGSHIGETSSDALAIKRLPAESR